VESTEALPAPLTGLATNAGLDLELTRCIIDGITLTGSVGSLSLKDCLVARGAATLEAGPAVNATLAGSPLEAALTALGATDPGMDSGAIGRVLGATPDVSIPWAARATGASLVGSEANARIDTSTLLGEVALRTLQGSESLFVSDLSVRVVQDGCLRYSYAMLVSRTPQRFRCQPDLAQASARSAALDQGVAFTEGDAAAVQGRVRPIFTSVTYGHPAYGQLARAVADELATGAEDGSEMGAFNLLKQAHRISNLRTALEKHLRFGLDAGLFFVT
jgi:hypothetical protein